MSETPATDDRALGEHLTLLGAIRAVTYPHRGPLLVQGSEEALLIDPSLALVGRGSLPRVDRVINSHCHEDHIAGNHLFPDLPWHLHALDHCGLGSLDGMMEIYGYAGPSAQDFRKAL